MAAAPSSRGLQVCQSAGTVRCGTVRYGTVRHSTVRPSTARYLPSSACPGGWFWYGKYLAGQPGRLLDQVLISLAGLVNLKRKKPQDTKAPCTGRVVALGCAPFLALAAIRSFRSLLKLELANLHQGLAANELSRAESSFRSFQSPLADRTLRTSRSSAGPRGMSAYKPRARFSNSLRDRHGPWMISWHKNKTGK